jgi:hypothetical protein
VHGIYCLLFLLLRLPQRGAAASYGRVRVIDATLSACSAPDIRNALTLW